MATILKNPSGTYQAQVRKKGHQPVFKSFRRKGYAVAWARRIEDEMSRGIYIDRSQAEQITVASALTLYLAEVSPTKAATTARSEKSKAANLSTILGKYSLAVITPDKVAAYRDSRLKTASPSQVRLELALLSHLFTTAMMEWHIGLSFNPALQVKKPTPPKGRERRLSKDEEVLLFQACRENKNPRLAWIVTIALETAARKMEILNLRRSQVDLASRTVILYDTKNKETRTVPLSKVATSTFEEVLNHPIRAMGTDLVFWGSPGANGERKPYIIDQVWRNTLKKAGIIGLRFHDLRHEATSRLVEARLSDQEVSTITGHKSMQMLKRYTHLRAEDLVARLDQADRG